MDTAGIIKEISTAAWQESEKGDYIGQDDLLYCGKCNTRKEARYMFMNKIMKVHVMCDCSREAFEKEKAERERRERIMEIQRRKATCIQDRGLIECTFVNDDGSLPQIASAKKYVET